MDFMFVEDVLGLSFSVLLAGLGTAALVGILASYAVSKILLDELND
jgi:uncharacterized membrane protein (Fun14 family)